MEWIDWLILSLYLLLIVLVGLYLRRRETATVSSFFLGGRKLPWYIAGTSMVATTFAADTPLAVTELVAQHGVAGNWLWWNMLLGGMFTVFFYARLWRRAGIMTDCEFVSIRYSGPAARFLRSFRALYIGILMNVIVLAWVNLAMLKIMQVMLPGLAEQSLLILGNPIPMTHVVLAGLLLFVGFYTSLSGLLGVSFTDTIQFVVAMAGCVALAFFAVNAPEVGGLSGLTAQLPDYVMDFLPVASSGDPNEATTSVGTLQMGVLALVTYLGVQWWASWYPGAEPGGGGYVAQRMMATKDERHSLWATLWFQVAHYAVRPWPWILVALATLILYPGAPDPGATYVMAIRDLMPSGWLGILIAAFLAAYMSTMASQTVWGTSYIINDLVMPNTKGYPSQKSLVRYARITTYVLLGLSLVVCNFFDRISDAWKFILACSGGMGLVLMLRWFWWRINAWSEITAMLAPFIFYPVATYALQYEYEAALLFTVGGSTLSWLIVTFATRPTSTSTLQTFYRRVHPSRNGWRRIAASLPDVQPDGGLPFMWIAWLLGCIAIMGLLFGIGKLLFAEWILALVLLSGSILCFVGIALIMRRAGWKNLLE